VRIRPLATREPLDRDIGGDSTHLQGCTPRSTATSSIRSKVHVVVTKHMLRVMRRLAVA
jgi:hypothetical protein